MTIERVHWFLELFWELGVRVWLDGGWGVDALLGEQTRPHVDLDIMIPSVDSATLVQALRIHGFDDVPTDDRVDENFVMAHPEHGQIDFHVFELADDGTGLYKPGVEDWIISAEELNCVGSVGGREARCLTAEYQVRSHSGYTLTATDAHDLALLSERFGIDLIVEQKDAVAKFGRRLSFDSNE